MSYKIRAGSRKQELKQPDAFIGTMDRFQDWAERNVRGIVSAVMVLALAGVLAVGWLFYSKKQEEEALALEFEARQFFQQEGAALEEGEEATAEENYKKAISLYREVIENYPRSKSAVMARYYIGNAYMSLEDFDSAITSYEAFLSSKKGSPVLRGFVFQRLGYAYLGKGQTDKAIETFRTGVDVEGSLNKDQIYYELGHLYHNRGNNDEAIRNYQAVVNGFPDSLFLSEAQSHLKELGVTEVKQEPGAPPPGEMTKEPAPKEEAAEGPLSGPVEK